MVLLYTGAPEANRIQPLPDQSLGGYPSTSPVPNARLTNIFSMITKKVVTTNSVEVKMIVIKNTSGVTVTGIKIYTTTPNDSICTLQLAAVAPATDTCNNPVFEQIIDPQSLPYQATFSSCEGIGNAIDVASLLNNAYIGIWIQRNVNQSKFPQLVGDPIGTPLTGTDLVSALEDQVLTSEQDVQLNISWT